jgi:CMP-N-acetylneuraminic acid synthetase
MQRLQKSPVNTEKTIITPQTRGIVVDEITVQDIDTGADWKLAELKYKLLRKKIICKKKCLILRPILIYC